MKNGTLLAIALAAAAACNNPPAGGASTCDPPGAIRDAGEKILSVNGTPVGANELDLVYRRMQIPEGLRKDFPWTKGGKHVAEEYALATMLYQRAVDEKLLDDPQLQLELAFLQRDFMSSAMRRKLAFAAVTEEGVQKFYESKKDLFDKPEVHVRQILAPSLPLAESMVDRLKKGEDFEALAKAHSIDQESAARGGDIGWFHRGDNKELGDKVFEANKGDILPPIESRLGFHVVEILDKRDRTPIEDVRPMAEQFLANQEATRVLEEMRSAMKIEWVREPEGGGGHGATDAPLHGAPGGAPGEAPPHGAPGGAPGEAPPHGAPGGAPPHGAAGGAPPHGAPGGAPPHGGTPSAHGVGG